MPQRNACPTQSGQLTAVGKIYPSCGRPKQRKKIIVGAWNVRTLLDRDDVARPQRKTALVAKELARYNIDIAAISKTRLAEEGQVSETGSGYTFFWKGKAQNEDRIHGVGFAIKTSLPTGINERLMKLRIPISNKRFLTIISAYAPTLTSAEEVKEQFYADLDALLRTTPTNDKLLVLGDFNARVGRDSDQWKGVIGKHGTGKMNGNGLLLLSKCAEYDLLLTNTTFRLADKFKTTWMHPRSKQWHLIDYTSPANVTAEMFSSQGQCAAQIARLITDLLEQSSTSASSHTTAGAQS